MKRNAQMGFSLLEVLIAMTILSIALLGIAGLQMTATQTDIESQQKAKIEFLLEDMTSRIDANRKNADSYVTGGTNYLGVGNSTQPSSCGSLLGKDLDFCEWNQLLQNSGIPQTRGCIYQTDSTVPKQYMIAVAWHPPLKAGSQAIDCASAAFAAGGQKVLTRTLRIGKLD